MKENFVEMYPSAVTFAGVGVEVGSRACMHVGYHAPSQMMMMMMMM
jgi:hypothetical protein